MFVYQIHFNGKKRIIFEAEISENNTSMNFSTQKSYGNRSGIQASQLILRDPELNDSIPIGNASENVNRCKNANPSTRRFRLSEYFTKDLRAKTSSTYHFLCGPLNTRRLTRKSITCNFDNNSNSAPPPNVTNLYHNLKQINNKPPWIEHPEPGIISVDVDKSTTNLEVDSTFKFDPLLDENFLNDVATSIKEQATLQDGEVPDPMRIDLNESCPLYDSSEYAEQRSNQINERNTSDDEKSEPDISRYNFFVPSCKEFAIQKDDIDDCSVQLQVDNKAIRSKPLRREEVFLPMVTSPDEDDFSVIESSPAITF